LLTACPVFGPAKTNPDLHPPPNDFHVRYEWHEGSVPPPYHYEYTIELEGDGAGKVIMIPDYPAANVPVWTEAFRVETEAVHELYRKMSTAGVWTERWRAQAHPPVGGSLAWLIVAANGQTVKIPPFPAFSQAVRAEAVYQAITSLVPAMLWAKLDTQRQTYQDEQLRR
jgi:hypothetical protein